MAETIVLDASGIAVNRTQLDITSYVQVNGVDWGDAEIQAYTATLTVGEVRLHYRLPNRLIKIPLALKVVGGTSFATIRANLQAKVGLFQREGGWIMRQVGATPLYADIQSATLHLGGSWLQAYRDIDIDAVLALECLPDWYGDEVTLGNHTETVLPHLFFTEATINGAYPGRCRVVATNGTTVDQHGLLWGFRSRNYDAGTAAALFYEAEKLVPVSGAAATAIAGASGGTAIGLGLPVANAWIPVLSSYMLSGSVPLTHTGSYRVWGRCYSSTDVPKFRFQWGAGAAAVPITNDPIQLPGTAAFYMLDLGVVRLDASPVGPSQWAGVVQAQTASLNGQAAVDCLYFQPLDEGAGKLMYTPTAPASAVQSASVPATAANDAAVGTIAWTASTGTSTAAFVANLTTSQYLKLTNFGFAIPGGATILGIIVNLTRQSTPSSATIQDNAVRLVKAGTVQATDRKQSGSWLNTPVAKTYGTSSDLWGGAWAASDINNSGFGFAISATNNFTSPDTASVSGVTITVVFTLSSGFIVAPDAVLAASGTAELRTDGMIRQGAGGTIYAAESNVIGDLPRVPPTGLEGRTLQVFLKQSRGNFSNEPDSAIDDMSALIKYRPSYLITP